MSTCVRFGDLGKALARIEENQAKEDAGGNHALAANLRSTARWAAPTRLEGIKEAVVVVVKTTKADITSSSGHNSRSNSNSSTNSRRSRDSTSLGNRSTTTSRSCSINSRHLGGTLTGLNQHVPIFVPGSQDKFTTSIGRHLHRRSTHIPQRLHRATGMSLTCQFLPEILYRLREELAEQSSSNIYPRHPPHIDRRHNPNRPGTLDQLGCCGTVALSDIWGGFPTTSFSGFFLPIAFVVRIADKKNDV